MRNTMPDTMRALRELEDDLHLEDTFVLLAAILSTYGCGILRDEVIERLTPSATDQLSSYDSLVFYDPSRNGLVVYLAPVGGYTFFSEEEVLRLCRYMPYLYALPSN